MKQNPGKGFVIAIISAITFAGMGALVGLNKNIDVAEQVFIRAVVGMFALLPFVWKEIPQLWLSPEAKVLWVRSLAGAASVWCYFYTLSKTNNANANLLYAGAPIFVVLLSYGYKDAALNRMQVIGVFMIVIGNLLLYLPHSSGVDLKTGIIGTLGSSMAGTAMYSLGNATRIHSPKLIVFGFCAGCAIAGLVMSGGNVFHFRGLNPTIMAVTMGILGLLAQISLTVSFQHLDASVASALGRTGIIWGAIMDSWLYSFHPSLLAWLSYATVISGVYVTQVLGSRRKQILTAQP